MTEVKMSNARRIKFHSHSHSVSQTVVLTHSVALVFQDDMIARRAVILCVMALYNIKATKITFNSRSKAELNHVAAAITREIDLFNRLTLVKVCYKSFRIKSPKARLLNVKKRPRESRDKSKDALIMVNKLAKGDMVAQALKKSPSLIK